MCFSARLLRAIEPPDPQRRQARALPSTASERLDDLTPRRRSGRAGARTLVRPETCAMRRVSDRLPVLGWLAWSSSRAQAKRRGGEALASRSEQASVRVVCGKGRSALCQLTVTCTLELDLH